MRNRTAAGNAPAANTPKPRHLRLVRIARGITYPCLSGCEYAHSARNDYAEDVHDSGHTCIVVVGSVDTGTGERLEVSVIRWRSTSGRVGVPSVEMTGGLGSELDYAVSTSATRALDLAVLLARAAELAAEVERLDNAKVGA